MTGDTIPGAGQVIDMMNTNKRGRPFLKDTLDLFATLILSLRLATHRQFFRSFPCSFTTEDAVANLFVLQFSQSNRGPDSRGSSHIVTTSTSTELSMTREMAKGICQHFMDARLIENAADRNCHSFKERGVYVLTPKGLHVLERFISKSGISTQRLADVLASRPVCSKLMHLERRSTDDEIIISQAVITHLFRCFAGQTPNYTRYSSVLLDPSLEYNERSKGIPLVDMPDRKLVRSDAAVCKHCFQAVTALEWLCDFTSIVDRDEAAEIAAHFVRFGLIALVSDKHKANDSAIVFTVRGSAPAGNSSISQYGEFRCTPKAIYRITYDGRRVARWDLPSDHHDPPNPSTANNSKVPRLSLEWEGAGVHDPAKLDLTMEVRPQHRTTTSDCKGGTRGVVESNTDTLTYILNEPALVSLFRDFLRTSFREDNLSFWLAVEDFKRKTNTALSSASGAEFRRINGKSATEPTPTLILNEDLIQVALSIYNTYLAPSGQRELDIDHSLRGELVNYLSQVMTDIKSESSKGRVEPEQAKRLNVTQLQTLTRLYGRIQDHVSFLMATESIPKFIKTPEFIMLRAWVADEDSADEDVQDQGR